MSRLTVIIDYGSGNLRSAAKAFERVAGGEHPVIVSSDPEYLCKASHIVLPGVGAFADCMRGLKAVPGMLAALERQVLEHKKPFLGICVGMQMLFTRGHEHGAHAGLGWIEGEVVKLEARNLKIPHMGWNELNLTQPQHPLLADMKNGEHVYFVHSYHAVTPASHMLATTEYGGVVTAVVARGNIMGVQFHPEKSQAAGLRVIENFLRIQ